MRQLSPQEKAIAKKISCKEECFSKLISFSNLDGWKVVFKYDPFAEEFFTLSFCSENPFESSPDDIEALQFEILQTINLINYFIKIDYIFKIQRIKIKLDKQFGQVIDCKSGEVFEDFNCTSNHFVDHKVTDKKLVEEFKNLIDQRICTTTGLAEFVNDDFKTKSDIYNEKALKHNEGALKIANSSNKIARIVGIASIIAALLSTAATVFSIMVTIYSAK